MGAVDTLNVKPALLSSSIMDGGIVASYRDMGCEGTSDMQDPNGKCLRRQGYDGKISK